MIITRDYAKRLIRKGKARRVGLVYSNGRINKDTGITYEVIERLDLCRIDHTLLK